MKISSFGYCTRQGVKNIWRNKMFSVASIATMSACIFLFGIFFAVLMNFNLIMRNIETDVNITVFFEEGLDQAGMDEIGEQISSRDEVTDCKYVSADEAWDSFREQYFEGYEDAAEGFRDNQDNPLANSAHYEVYVDKVENQDALVDYISTLDGVRSVNQSEDATNTLSSVNKLIAIVSLVIIAILLVVSIFLISNTVSVGISVRREEISIMKLIGATNGFVRMPFILEGVLIGLIGAAIPLVLLYILYDRVISFVMTKFSVLEDFMSGIMSVNAAFRVLLPVGLALGIGIGLLGSLFTIRKHLKV